jgi:DNA invertase Pin-like site-specific DNA recombinase
VALESQVKEVLSTAKAKLTDLSKDIDRLSRDNENLQRQVEYAEHHRVEL